MNRSPPWRQSTAYPQHNPYRPRRSSDLLWSVRVMIALYVLELGTVALPKTADPAHMKENAAVDFLIDPADMEKLMRLPPIESYGEFSCFPVFSGK